MGGLPGTDLKKMKLNYEDLKKHMIKEYRGGKGQNYPKPPNDQSLDQYIRKNNNFLNGPITLPLQTQFNQRRNSGNKNSQAAIYLNAMRPTSGNQIIPQGQVITIPN